MVTVEISGHVVVEIDRTRDSAWIIVNGEELVNIAGFDSIETVRRHGPTGTSGSHIDRVAPRDRSAPPSTLNTQHSTPLSLGVPE